MILILISEPHSVGSEIWSAHANYPYSPATHKENHLDILIHYSHPTLPCFSLLSSLKTTESGFSFRSPPLSSFPHPPKRLSQLMLLPNTTLLCPIPHHPLPASAYPFIMARTRPARSSFPNGDNGHTKRGRQGQKRHLPYSPSKTVSPQLGFASLPDLTHVPSRRGSHIQDSPTSISHTNVTGGGNQNVDENGFDLATGTFGVGDGGGEGPSITNLRNYHLLRIQQRHLPPQPPQILTQEEHSRTITFTFLAYRSLPPSKSNFDDQGDPPVYHAGPQMSHGKLLALFSDFGMVTRMDIQHIDDGRMQSMMLQSMRARSDMNGNDSGKGKEKANGSKHRMEDDKTSGLETMMTDSYIPGKVKIHITYLSHQSISLLKLRTHHQRINTPPGHTVPNRDPFQPQNHQNQHAHSRWIKFSIGEYQDVLFIVNYDSGWDTLEVRRQSSEAMGDLTREWKRQQHVAETFGAGKGSAGG